MVTPVVFKESEVPCHCCSWCYESRCIHPKEKGADCPLGKQGSMISTPVTNRIVLVQNHQEMSFVPEDLESWIRKH